MNSNQYSSIDQLLEHISEYKGIHIECNREQSNKIMDYIIKNYSKEKIAYIIHTDKGYERESIYSYLKLFHRLFNPEKKLEQVLKEFNLEKIRKKKLYLLDTDENMRVQIARISMQNCMIYCMEDPLLNLKEENVRVILEWIIKQSEKGIKLITTNSSLRYALLMPGVPFYMEKEQYFKLEQEEEENTVEENEIEILKIPVKSGNSTLLFEPKDIDFIESQNKCNYLSIRGSLFPVQKTMDELESLLEKSGFFRCHRSYIVNMQKVERIEKITKNSYLLFLLDQPHSQIPLSKGRVERMKELYHW